MQSAAMSIRDCVNSWPKEISWSKFVLRITSLRFFTMTPSVTDFLFDPFAFLVDVPNLPDTCTLNVHHTPRTRLRNGKCSVFTKTGNIKNVSVCCVCLINGEHFCMTTISGTALVSEVTLIFWRRLFSINTINDWLSFAKPSYQMIFATIWKRNFTKVLLQTPLAYSLLSAYKVITGSFFGKAFVW